MPPLPPSASHLWFALVDLQATRDRGMAVGPITWAEINAYEAATCATLSAWDKRLIRRCDDAYEAVRLGVKSKPTNVADIKASLRAAIAARNAKAAKGAPK
uniref:Uncharacterized protein n=2 Tax=viral metagenome TaxID=1070528 RepID=A0A6M3Y3R6_9ZZZZ